MRGVGRARDCRGTHRALEVVVDGIHEQFLRHPTHIDPLGRHAESGKKKQKPSHELSSTNVFVEAKPKLSAKHPWNFPSSKRGKWRERGASSVAARACLQSRRVAARGDGGRVSRIGVSRALTDRRAPDTCCRAPNTAGAVRWRHETESREIERQRCGNGAPDQVRRHALCNDAAARQRNGVSQHHLRLSSAQDGVLQRAKGLCSPTLSLAGAQGERNRAPSVVVPLQR